MADKPYQMRSGQEKVCVGCGTRFSPRPNESTWAFTRRKYCSRGCGAMAGGLARRAVARPPSERFWEKVEKRATAGCWPWLAHDNGDGYGMFWVGTEAGWKTAHRFAYEQLVGQVPAGLELDHLCRNRACVNPDHLEPVTRSENTLRGIGPEKLKERTDAAKAARTHCKRGHRYTPETTYINPQGWRSCKTCRNIRERARRRNA